MKARKSKWGCSVSVSAAELQDFADRWPGSGMRNATRGMRFDFDSRGNLVDLHGEREGYDESAVRALSEDAQAAKCPRR